MSAVHRSTSVASLALLLVVAACSSDETTPVGIEPHEGGLVALLPTDCEITTLNRSAKDYFGANNNPASADIRALGDACKAYSSAKTQAARDAAQAAANDAGFAVLEDVGAEASSSAPGDPAAGASVVRRVLDFMSIGADNTPGAFEGALGSRGMFRVRGPGTAVTTGSRGGAPEWRLRAAWSTRTLVYGYPTSLDAGGTLISASNGKFDLNTLPVGQVSSANRALIAYCAPNVTLTNNWVQHHAISSSSTHSFLTEETTDVAAVCAETAVAAAPTASERLLAAADRAWSLLAPAELFALERVKVGGVGGFGSDLSPYFVANLGVSVATFVTQPTGGTVSGGITTTGSALTIRITSANGGVALANAFVVVTVANNSGAPAGATISYPDPDNVCPDDAACGVTDINGLVSFPGIRVNKPGGYLLSAASTFDGSGSGSTISAKFNIQNP